MKALRHPLTAGFLTSLILSCLVVLHRCGPSVTAIGDFVDALERRSLDARFSIRGAVPTGPEVVILAYDDRTFREDPTLMQHRSGWARVIRAVSQAGAKVIGVDFLFDTRGDLLSPELSQAIGDYLKVAQAASPASAPATLLLRWVLEETQGDAILEAAIRAAGNVVLGFYVGSQTDAGLEKVSLAKGAYGQSFFGKHRPPYAEGVMASLPGFVGAARAQGMLSAAQDVTETIRDLPFVRGYGNMFVAPLSVYLTALHLGFDRKDLSYLGETNSIRIGRTSVQLDEDFSLLLNYRGPGKTFATESVVDLVKGRLSPDRLKDKIVLIGMTYLGHDRSRTPTDRGFPSVEIHATAIDNMLRGDPLRRSSALLDGLICLLLGMAFSIFYWPRLLQSPWVQLTLSCALLLAYLAVCQWQFSSRNLWWPCAWPVLLFVSVTMVCLVSAYLGEGLRRRKLRKMFEHFLAPEVIDDLSAHPGAMAAVGARRQCSVLFSDVRDFTSLAEELAPDKLVAFLNAYFSPMTRVVLANGGLLDKYIGDAIMAVFGAPLANLEHPRQALDCVRDMRRELTALQQSAKLKGRGIEIGVGVNTGEMVVGLMGSAEVGRFNYTAVGDAVNLASRLQGLTRLYGVFCLVGEATRSAVGPAYHFREIDRVRVKGKTEIVAIHEFLGGPKGEVASYQGLETFQQGLVDYRDGHFREALTAFSKFSGNNPHDKVVSLFLDRLRQMGDQPPPLWNGVFDHVEK